MQGLICVPNAQLLVEPNKRSELADEVMYGTIVDVLDESINYYFIHTFYGYKGYIRKEEALTTKIKFDYHETFNGIITKPFLDVLTDPDFHSQPILSLPMGSYVKILPIKTINGFHPIELVNQKKGFIREDGFKYRKPLNFKYDEEPLRKQLVHNAMLFLNTQYRWGGKTMQGIDCSGLCSMSYLLEDYIIYRDAIFKDDLLKAHKMKSISRSELKPADLIYCPSHMMMYLGDELYIHSSMENSGVAINSLNPTNLKFSEKIEKKIVGFATIF